MKQPKLQPNELHNHLRYDPATGEIFRKHHNPTTPAYMYRGPKGWQLDLLGSRYYARSVVWAMMTGGYPEPQKVKYLDGDKYNLKWSNLAAASPGTKICTACKNEKTTDQFFRNKGQRDGYDTRCKACTPRPPKERYDRHTLKSRAKKRGLSADDVVAMSAAQNGVCAICKKTCATGRNLAIDHCHATNKVRALLCTACNTGLGAFRDDPRLLVEAAKYILKHQQP